MPKDTFRRTAEITDDGKILSPEVEVIGDVDERILEAVEAAVDENPNNLDAPRLIGDGAVQAHAEAVLDAQYNEIPVSEDGELKGWLAPYRAREEVDASLREALPDDVDLEAENNHATGFYRL